MQRPRILTRRRALILLAALVAAALLAAAVLPTYPLTEDDKARAARDVVAWFVEGKPLPGSGEQYADANWMRSRRRFFVVCDFLPEGASISPDARAKSFFRRVRATGKGGGVQG